MTAFAMLTVIMPSSISVKASAENWGQDYDTAKTFSIADKDELLAFRDMVNSGKSFSGKTVTLQADIDLASEEWIPIGREAKAFEGSFQGNNKKIKNLTITNKDLNSAGFFGITGGGSNSVIQDLTLENVHIDANQTVGALGGYMVTRTVNCQVIGNIHISGTFMVGGLAGDHYSKIENSHVNGNAGSIISGRYVEANREGDNIGGLIGLRGEGSNLVQDSSVSNVKISGTRKIGGFIGAAFLSNSFENCEVNNVIIETNASVEYANDNVSSLGLGGMIGVFNNHTPNGHITSSTVSDVAFIIPENIKDIVKAGYMYGLSRAASKTPDLADNFITGTNTGSNNALDSVEGITTHYTRLEPTCVEDGHIEYWMSVDKYYKDAKRTEEITETDTILAASGHHAVKVDAKAPSCIEEGNIAYWYCDQCDEYFSDEALTTKVDKADVMIAITNHDAIKVDAKAPTCTEEGHIEYWYCEECDQYFLDEALTTKANKEDLILAVVSHKAVKIDAKAPTCTEKGNIAYWYCEECDQYFLDETLQVKLTKEDTILNETDHLAFTLVNVKQASCTEEGYTGDLVCKYCGELIKQGKATAKLAHHFVNGECSECGEKDPHYVASKPIENDTQTSTDTTKQEAETETSPRTGDETNIAVWMILMMASVLGIVHLHRKHTCNED